MWRHGERDMPARTPPLLAKSKLILAARHLPGGVCDRKWRSEEDVDCGGRTPLWLHFPSIPRACHQGAAGFSLNRAAHFSGVNPPSLSSVTFVHGLPSRPLAAALVSALRWAKILTASVLWQWRVEGLTLHPPPDGDDEGRHEHERRSGQHGSRDVEGDARIFFRGEADGAGGQAWGGSQQEEQRQQNGRAAEGYGRTGAHVSGGKPSRR